MRARRTFLGLLLVCVAVSASSHAAPPASSTAAPASSAAAPASSAAAPASSAAALPVDHPTTTAAPGGVPHPTAEQAAPAGRDRFLELQDRTAPDPSLPAGTIEILVLDDNNVPIANQALELEVLKASIATGDVKESRRGTTDAQGIARFAGETTTTDYSYRAIVRRDPAAFTTQSFSLPLTHGQRATLHVFPVIRDLTGALIVMAEQISVEPKGDRFRISVTLDLQNFGRTALAPDSLQIGLPVGAEAFSTGMEETEQKVELTGDSVSLRGTYPPGTHRLSYSFNVPGNGDATQTLSLGVAPNLRSVVLAVEAAADMALVAPQLGETQERQHTTGQRILIASRDYLQRRERSPSALRITLTGMPVPSSARTIASVIAALVAAFGLFRLWTARRGEGAWRGLPASDLARARDLLLDELVALEAAYAKEKIGPRTYERAKATLLDSLGRLLAQPSSGGA
jgi:hypothetical protein